MGMVITAAGATRQASSEVPPSTVELAGRAARDCLTKAQLSPAAIGAVINVGVYRESNTFEPALAALVQKEAEISLDYLADPAAAFSFDLMNGACGVLNAIQVAQSLIETGSTERLLITAADVHPGGGAHRDPDYPYADLGGALLLQRSADPDVGFGPVLHYTADAPTDVQGYLDTTRMGTDGRNQITVARAQDHDLRLAELATIAVTSYAQTYQLDLECTQVVSAQTAAKGSQEDAGGEPHTAAPILGYLQAITAGRPEGCEQLLFVTAGAGPSASCVSYRPEGW
ncbi:hypothetical protein [Streptomyces sp. NPDC006879]|uniref:hypothetical protein n=1 Tax=Streptomyces sp. NPDC006879 TaxID=3364767 RepID=UPI0036A5A09F